MKKSNRTSDGQTFSGSLANLGTVAERTPSSSTTSRPTSTGTAGSRSSGTKDVYTAYLSPDLSELLKAVRTNPEHFRPGLLHLLESSPTIHRNPSPTERALLNEAVYDLLQPVRTQPAPPVMEKRAVMEELQPVTVESVSEERPYWWLDQPRGTHSK